MGNATSISTEQSAERQTARRMTGGRALAEMLKIGKVGPIFGMGGFQLLPFYEGVRVLGLEHHLVNDERCGAFAADAYARVTGRPGVCDATLGPGATNLVTALVESLNAGVPVIAIVGNTHRAHSWKNMTQEAKQAEILRPSVKEYIRVERIERIPELVRRAFTVATSGRPGPVVLDVPEDVAHAEYDFDASDFYINERVLQIPAVRTRPDSQDIERAAELLARAKRPLILAGGGVHLSGAQAELQQFAETFGIPVAHTLSGKGAIACTHEVSVGLFGRFSRIANELIDRSDCLLVVGCKLGEIATKRYEFPKPGVPLIHLDIVAEEIERWAPAAVSLWGDVKAGILELKAALSEKKVQDRKEYLNEVKKRKDQWYQEAKARYESKETPVNMARIIHELNQLMPEDGIVVADGGFASHWTGLLYDTKKPGRGFVSDRGFASIGYGLPGSLGTALACRDLGLNAPVIGITGDGGMNMTIGELETALRAKVPFTLIIVNNAASGYVKALQHSVYGEGNYQSSSLQEMNYAELARKFGCHGIRVEDPEQLKPVLSEAIRRKDVPTVVDVVVTRDPSRMLPGVDNRSLQVKPGDRPV